MQTYATMDVKLHPVKPEEVLDLALHYQLSAYDADTGNSVLNRDRHTRRQRAH